MDTYVIALDCGLTMTKAVVFDQSGSPLGGHSVRSPHLAVTPRVVERDAEQLWQAAAASLAGAVAAAHISAAQVAAIAITGHGDGLYLVDASGRPTRPGISSLDSRAQLVVDRWRADDTMVDIRRISGQEPFAASPSALLRFLLENEPDAVARSRWALSCKDYIVMRLTGIAGTDFSEASESFTAYRTQDYDDRLLGLYGLDSAERLRPPVRDPTAIVGALTETATAITGLPRSVVVVAGLHDVDASALGSGAIRHGQLVVVAGSYSINEIFTDEPLVDPRWLARNSPVRGRWLNMSISPTSMTCLEWFLQQGAASLALEANARQSDVYDLVESAYHSTAGDTEIPLFLPYLYGSPAEFRTDAAFLGLQGWHRQAHLIRAVLEGIVLNHRVHVDALRSGLSPSEIRLTGGAARAPYIAQLFADVLGLPVLGTVTAETGALGAALCALTGLGVFRNVEHAVDSVAPPVVRYEPRPAEVDRLEAQYIRFRGHARALSSIEEME